ncbi:helix-turn-helix transcriptional regulator [Caenimonas sp. SL110]|uniref:helix-turn-helix transcriptional regulator n=1 Tax=Caenimonas sp. SL110 TaxID=1450524 RepID=UPI00065349ED|nr:helix-turn-helix transcriptional regulator [Caenimonas sp. SL110]
MDVVANAWVQGGSLRGEDEGSAAYGLALLMDELAHGVMVTTIDGRILHANQAARHELARQRVIVGVQDKLQTTSAENMRVLQDALSRAAEGKRSLIELAATEGPGLSVAAVPLRGGAGKPAVAALFFARSMVCDSLMLTFYSRTHGLTATEEQVLGVLCQGYSAPQVALQMKIAVSTVRTHIRSLCAKTRSGGVRELVSRVAVLPPVAPPFWHEPLH